MEIYRVYLNYINDLVKVDQGSYLVYLGAVNDNKLVIKNVVDKVDLNLWNEESILIYLFLDIYYLF